MADAPLPDAPLPDPHQLPLERKWGVWVKHSATEWTRENLKKVFVIRTVADMWGLIHHIPEACVGSSNIFLIEESMIPLWELNGDVFRHGGCWSTVVKRGDWREMLTQLVATLVGETKFSTSVRGCCVIPVSKSQCISKVWCTMRNDADCTDLAECMAQWGKHMPRFKPFTA